VKFPARHIIAVAIVARLKHPILVCLTLLFVSETAGAPDDAVRLSWRVPDQNYYFRTGFAVLQKGNLDWYIPLWSCTPASLKIIKVLGKSPPAPYAVEITVGKNERIDATDNVMRLHSIHFLAASLGDAVKIRRALIAESEWMRKFLEKRQGNPPGYLKRVLESQTR
jgi:hypothetical protein